MLRSLWCLFKVILLSLGFRPADKSESFYQMMLLSAVLKHNPSSTSALTPLYLTPQSMALYWFTSSLVGFSHNLLLRSPVIHKFLRLQTQQSDSPYRDLLSAFITKYSKWINSVFWIGGYWKHQYKQSHSIQLVMMSDLFIITIKMSL